jgi:hypothetical protein
MRRRSRTGLRVVALLALLEAGCSERAGSRDGRESAAAAEALDGAYCIRDVQVDPFTYHFDSPRWVLDAAEGEGPRVLGVTIAGLAVPLVSTTVSLHPKESDISRAVGYSLGEFYWVQASAAFSVDVNDFQRLEAYLDYARSTWMVREAGCGAVLGAGVSFKPIGVYFVVRDAASVAIDGSSVPGLLPGCAGGPCGYAPPDQAGLDAGAGDGGGG